ncbi:MAG: PD40 domain-containing protein, partial [Myxococcales bacterium]|nr:PD40 domain-containing protein [Myxococcales bacterium]
VYLSIHRRWIVRELGAEQRELANGRQLIESDADLLGWSLSPDNLQIGYVESWGDMGRLYVRPVADGPTRELAATLGNVDLAWSPDGERVAYTAYHRGEAHIWIVSADSEGDGDGEAEVFADTRVGMSSMLLWPAADSIVYDRVGGGLSLLTPSTGRERELLPEGAPAFHRMISDSKGRSLVGYSLRDPRGLWVLNLDGSPPRSLLPGLNFPTDWEDTVLFTSMSHPERIMAIAPEGGEPELLRELEVGDERPICELGVGGTLICGSEISERSVHFARLP